jgi:transposase
VSVAELVRREPAARSRARDSFPADEDGLTKLVLACGIEVKACVEMMSGSVWVRDQLAAVGRQVQVAHARKVRDVAPLACKTDKVDARVLAELCRRDLVPELWVPSLQDRALRERLRRRMHLVRMRASAQNRIFGLLTQWGLRLSVKRLREPDAMPLLEARGVEQVWRRSIAEALAAIDLLDQSIAPLEVELATLARADDCVALLRTIPGSIIRTAGRSQREHLAQWCPTPATRWWRPFVGGLHTGRGAGRSGGPEQPGSFGLARCRRLLARVRPGPAVAARGRGARRWSPGGSRP